MKNKLLLAIIIFISVNQHGNCQHSFPTYTDSARWSELLCVYGIGYVCYTHIYQYQYDTVFCGHIYSKTTIEQQDGYIRSDNLRTYVRASTNCSDKEFLMYDYSKNPGDTLFTGFNLWLTGQGDSLQFVVDSIGTINISGVNRRVFHMGYYLNPVYFPNWSRPMDWIEGIGSPMHPFYPLSCFTDNCESQWNLLCYDSMGVALYRDTFYNTCDTSFTDMGINELSDNNTFSIFPNPATNSLHIASLSPVHLTEIMLYDLRGQLLLKQALVKEKTELDFSSFAKGMYIIKVENEKGIEVKRVIKE